MFKSLIYSISAWIIPSIILITLVFSVVKKIPVYETFIDGAKDGLKVTVGIIPYLIAIITAVSMLRASGAIDLAARAFSVVWITLKYLLMLCLLCLFVHYQVVRCLVCFPK